MATFKSERIVGAGIVVAAAALVLVHLPVWLVCAAAVLASVTLVAPVALALLLRRVNRTRPGSRRVQALRGGVAPVIRSVHAEAKAEGWSSRRAHSFR
jgi:membrane protein implicated in regulation of membrane protease activity